MQKELLDSLRHLDDPVLPRDLFNTAKLLKCLGRLSLHILDGVIPGMKLERRKSDQHPFICSDCTGALYCMSLELTYRGKLFMLSTPVNAQGRYPLECHTNETSYPVFRENGMLSEEFATNFNALSPGQPEPHNTLKY